MPRVLLERDPELDELIAAARDAVAGHGQVVLVYGEAGIGKTSLVAALRARPVAGTRVLVGSCDAMSTPRTLGPLRDLAPRVGARLAGALRGSDREEVFAALRDELADAPGTVLVVEDAHWADEATLDALRFLARRIDELPAVLVLTYRDELERDHPLNRLLGDLGHGDRVERIALRRLSADAVGALTAGSGLDADRVYEMTEGNPYFVSELVASAGGASGAGGPGVPHGPGGPDGPGAQSVPPTVVDAVRGRLSRLDGATQEHVEQLAVVPSAVDHELLGRLVPGAAGALRAAEEGGLVVVRPHGVRFRHELTRRAVVDALPASRRIELERRVLEALLDLGVADPARLVHHAIQAGEIDAVVEWAPRAARDAAASGAHRQAADHYAAVVAHLDRVEPGERGDLLQAFAIEAYTVGRAGEAVDAQRRAVEARRAAGDGSALGASLRWLSRVQWFAGDRAAAVAAAAEATAVLSDAGDSGLLAMALSNESQLAMLAHDTDRALELASLAIGLAREEGADSVLSHALTNHGTALMFGGDEHGVAELLEAAQVAEAAGDIENAARAHVNLVWTLLDEVRLDEAAQQLDRVMAFTERAEFLGFAVYQRTMRARLDLARARWDDALALVTPAPDVPHARCVALTVAGLVHTRRGDPEADDLLDEATALADRLDELQRRGPVAAARAEAALLRGDPASARAIARPVFDEAVLRNEHAIRAELARLLRASGDPVEVPPDDGHPFAVQARGEWRRAAGLWRAAGCPYHEASALAESPEARDLLDALAILDRIGAEPLARRVRADLRERGVRSIPRGPQAVTRRNPEGLTDRQAEVLRLVAGGLTNQEIADRLVVSVRTVDSHVAAVLAKLGVGSRREARRAARELGVLDTEAPMTDAPGSR